MPHFSLNKVQSWEAGHKCISFVAMQAIFYSNKFSIYQDKSISERLHSTIVHFVLRLAIFKLAHSSIQ